MAYYDITPYGQIMNLVSKDTDFADLFIPTGMLDFMANLI